MTRAPKAYRLDDTAPGGEGARARADLVLAETADPFEAEAAAALARDMPSARRKSFGWSGLFWSSLSALLSLAVGVWGWTLVENLFAASPALGWVGGALAALCLLALSAMGAREMLALSRLGRVAELRRDALAAFERDDAAAARKVVAALRALGGARPSAHAELETLEGEIIDGADLLKVAERVLLGPRDRRVREAVVAAAKRVSLVTALSPRAIVDVLFVLAQSARLVRRIADIYGGRPSALGSLRLGRAVLGHLAVTGGVALGDSLVSQALGAGLAARLSARLGEGVLNGVLTARVGLAAIAVCRPMPFLAEAAPTLRDLAAPLFGEAAAEPAKAAGPPR